MRKIHPNIIRYTERYWYVSMCGEREGDRRHRDVSITCDFGIREKREQKTFASIVLCSLLDTWYGLYCYCVVLCWSVGIMNFWQAIVKSTNCHKHKHVCMESKRHIRRVVVVFSVLSDFFCTSIKYWITCNQPLRFCCTYITNAYSIFSSKY